jgi:hypothetical protein
MTGWSICGISAVNRLQIEARTDTNTACQPSAFSTQLSGFAAGDTMEMKVRDRRILPVAGIALLLTVFLSGMPAFAAVQGDGGIDQASVRREILSFEAALNNAINATFSSSPFALVQKPKGVFLQGYGVTFNFLINIHRAVINTPFGEVRTQPDITPELKKRKIEELKDRLIRVLADSGDGLRQIRKSDTVSIVIFLEDRNFPDEPNENKTLVLSILKTDLEEAGRGEDRWRELKQRIKTVEY